MSGPWLLAGLVVLAPIPLPNGEGGIGFDDLRYVPAVKRLLVPSGGTGRLNLIDPERGTVDSVEGVTAQKEFAGGHGAGTTSADAGGGFLFASDRNRRTVQILDAVGRRVLAEVHLAGSPDYVRWVEPTSEVWVTEPGREVVEYFRLERSRPPALVLGGTISVPDGPESLVIDATRGRAYTHTWHDATMAVDLATHKVVARWSNGCKASRGIALDERRGWLFVGCEEGRATALDVAHAGKRMGSVETAKGVDIIAYCDPLKHLYVPGGESATLSTVSVSPDGGMKVLSTSSTAPGAHCVAVDDLGHVYVCDPSKGRLLRFADK